MQPTNILSAYQGCMAFKNKKVDTNKKINNYFTLKEVEVQTLSKFYELLKKSNCEFELFDGYYIGYTIKQISKEFDLLRFSDKLVIDIELKSHLDNDEKIEKITKQMSQNYYYLRFLGKMVSIYTFVEDDGLYKYNVDTNKCYLVDIKELVTELSTQTINDKLNPDDLFVPSNYLISPFNNTDKFINEEYFLTDNQQAIKKQVLEVINNNQMKFFCVSANAGTGKTLMLYDIAKTIYAEHGKSAALIFHCGKLNEGHLTLNTCHRWNIHRIADVNGQSVEKLIHDKLKVILFDETQRIRTSQLNLIINKAIELHIPIVFCYDKKQFLNDGETLDLYEYVNEKFNMIQSIRRELKGKIRTNKEMASFIKNLLKIGESNADLNYDAISVDYFDSVDDVREYIDYLETNQNWKAITYTTSQYDVNRLSYLSNICLSTAHDVIGQEFDKVVFVMDENFKYDEEGKLLARGSYYSAEGMLYQIVTRVINQLKIVVLDNPDLYCKILEIKTMNE
ncbi:MAG: DUF2075 domain-containing protein [Oscillospiraceae bacterium]|nr:DUF2075 domain-containing protein [Oscillospiraceae bacterium]